MNNCENCRNSKRKLHFLGWRLWCQLYKRPTATTDKCIDWRRNGGK